MQEVHQPILVLNEITDELADISEFLDLEIVLAEESVEIGCHLGSLLKCGGSTVHHAQVVDVVR